MGCTDSLSIGPGGQVGGLSGVANMDENFLAHHLRNEQTLSLYVRADRIRRRQIIQHSFIDGESHKYWGNSPSSSQQILTKSWLQRLFFQCIDEAEIEFFKEKRNYDDVRKKIADSYLFEIYQACQFSNAATSMIRGANITQLIIPLSYYGIPSDSCLYAVLKELKAKFPQVADNSKVKFPNVQEKKNDVDLLGNIPNCKSFSEPEFFNLNTTLFDLEFLIERAISEYEDFKSDMEFLLGKQVLTDTKVKCEKRGDTKVYTASAVRRVFIKWVETMIERIPEIRETEPYIDFVDSKSFIFDNFHIMSGGFTPSIQDTIIKILLNLLEGIKFKRQTAKNGKGFDFIKNPKYGFFIYDLLRCKIHRNTPEQIMQVVDSLYKTTTTSSGKKFKVVRVKNRFNTPNRDLMVNFSYGDVIVAEAQLCVDSSDVDQKAKKTNKFNHYLYELERGLFGPTVELMMQYEDFNRPNLITKMYFEGSIGKRNTQNKYKNKIIAAGRKCPAGHDMIEIKENYFFKVEGLSKEQVQNLTFSCDFCFTTDLPMNQPYHYCEKCGSVYCMACKDQYIQYYSSKPPNQHCNIPTPELDVKSAAQFKQKVSMKRATCVLFYILNSAPSTIFKDYLTNGYLLLKSFGVKMDLLFCRADLPENKPLLQQYELKKFPSVIIVNGQAQLYKTLVGASIHVFDGMDDFKTELIKSQNPSIPCMCKNPLCSHVNKRPMQLIDVGEEEEDWKCCQCLDITAEEGLSELFAGLSKEKSKAFKCLECHAYICLQCGFLGYPDKATYLDPQGASYLSSEIKNPKSVQCPQNHNMQYIRKNVLRQSKYDCCKCRKNFFFNDDEGMAYCEQCSLYACPSCIGAKSDTNMDQKFEKELVSHFTETAAPDCKKCTFCKRSMRKTYKPRLRAKKIQAEDEDERAIDNFVDMFSGKLKDWTCCDCERSYKEGVLHLACVSCQYDMCISCAQKNLMFKTLEKPDEDIVTPYQCQNNHTIVKTKKSPEPGMIKMECQCERLLYPNTEHFACNECNKFWCKTCGLKKFREDGAGECDEGHQLITRNKTPTPFGVTCNKNPNHQMQGKYFYYTCPKCEDYNVCNLGQCINDSTAKCNRGHPLKLFEQPNMKTCTSCQNTINTRSVGCDRCGLYICEDCAT